MFLSNISEDEKGRIEKYADKALDWFIDKMGLFLIAVVFLCIGFKISKLIAKILKKSMDRHDVEKSVSGFLYSLIKGILYIVVFIMAASMVGFQVTSLVTILGTASLAIGLALQGSLANFAGGVLILIMKPFKVGDYIIETAKNNEGTVVSIDIFYTKLKTYDNKIVVIPNGTITANSIVNVTALDYRRIDLFVGVSYDSNIKLVKDTLNSIVCNSKYYEKGKEINIFVDSFEASSIKMGIRFYVATENYFNARWELLEEIKIRFDEIGITIPFNQLEVSLKK